MRFIPHRLDPEELIELGCYVEASVRDALLEPVCSRKGSNAGKFTPAEWRQVAVYLRGRWPAPAMHVDRHLPEVSKLRNRQRLRRWGYRSVRDVQMFLKDRARGLFE